MSKFFLKTTENKEKPRRGFNINEMPWTKTHFSRVWGFDGSRHGALSRESDRNFPEGQLRNEAT